MSQEIDNRPERIVRVQPNSFSIGLKKTPMEKYMPKMIKLIKRLIVRTT